MKVVHRDKIIGEIKNNTYISHRTPEHFMRKYRGFGISKDILYNLLKNGVDTIRIVYQGNKMTIFESPIVKWKNSNKFWTFDGDDEQVFLCIDDMNDILTDDDIRLNEQLHHKEEKQTELFK